jgi:hypothetical protein
MSICAIAACEGKAAAVADIGGAFLNATMPKTGVKVLVRIEPTLSRRVIQAAIPPHN